MNLTKPTFIIFLFLSVFTINTEAGIVLLLLLKILALKGALLLGVPLAIGSFVLGQGLGFFAGKLTGSYLVLRAHKHFRNKFHNNPYHDIPSFTSYGGDGWGHGYKSTGHLSDLFTHGYKAFRDPYRNQKHYGFGYNLGRTAGKVINLPSRVLLKLKSMGFGSTPVKAPVYSHSSGYSSGYSHKPVHTSTSYGHGGGYSSFGPYSGFESGSASYYGSPSSSSYSTGSPSSYYGYDTSSSATPGGGYSSSAYGPPISTEFGEISAFHPLPQTDLHTFYSGDGINEGYGGPSSIAAEAYGAPPSGVVSSYTPSTSYSGFPSDTSSSSYGSPSGPSTSYGSPSGSDSSATYGAPSGSSSGYSGSGSSSVVQDSYSQQPTSGYNSPVDSYTHPPSSSYINGPPAVYSPSAEGKGSSYTAPSGTATGNPTGYEASAGSDSNIYSLGSSISEKIISSGAKWSDYPPKKEESSATSQQRVDQLSEKSSEVDAEAPEPIPTLASGGTPSNTEDLIQKFIAMKLLDSKDTKGLIENLRSLYIQQLLESFASDDNAETSTLTPSTPNGTTEPPSSSTTPLPLEPPSSAEEGRPKRQTENQNGNPEETERQALDRQFFDSFYSEITKFFSLLSAFDQDSCLQKLVCQIHTKSKSHTLTTYESNMITTFKIMNVMIPLNHMDSSTKYRVAAQLGEKSGLEEVCLKTYETCNYSATQIIDLGTQVEQNVATAQPDLEGGENLKGNDLNSLIAGEFFTPTEPSQNAPAISVGGSQPVMPRV